MPRKPKDLMPTAQAAKFAGVVPATVTYWVRVGQLTCHGYGPKGTLLVSKAQLLKYIQTRGARRTIAIRRTVYQRQAKDLQE